MARSHLRRTSICLVSVAILLGPAVPASAEPPGRPPGPATATDRPAPAQGLASIVGELGLRAYPDVFSGLRVDQAANRVVLYGTDSARLAALVDEARGKAPATLRGITVEPRLSAYSRRQLEAARAEMWKNARGGRASGVETYLIAVRSDGSGLDVSTNNPAALSGLLAARTSLAGLRGTDVNVRAGSRVTTVNRHNDFAPYFAGAPLFGQNRQRCTGAFGMRTAAFEYLVSAEHCFTSGEDVRDGGGDPIGEAWIRNDLRDMVGIRTDAGGGVYFNNNSEYHIYGRAAYSWNGEVVCQSGYTSDRICTISVINENLQWQDDSGKIRQGVMGQQCGGCIAVRPGDSGGPVWSTAWDGVVESRGIVSAGSTPVGNGFQVILWTETVPVLEIFGGSLITSLT